MKIDGTREPWDTPCVGTCSTTPGGPVCVGCGRTAEEVIKWNTYSRDQKIRINQRLLNARLDRDETP